MNKVINSSIKKRIGKLTLGSFLSLLISEDLSIIKIKKPVSSEIQKKESRLNERDIISTFLPDQIIKKISTKSDGKEKSEGTMIGYMSRLSMGDDYRDEIAREILADFIIHPFETVNLFLSHVCTVLYDKNTYVDYKALSEFLKCVVFGIEYLPGKNGFFGKYLKDFSETINKLFYHKQYISILTNIIISLIIGSVTDKKEYNAGLSTSYKTKFRDSVFSDQFEYLLFLIWLPEKDLVEKSVSFSLSANLSDFKSFIRYPFAVILSQRKGYESAAKLINSISDETGNNVIHISYIQLLYAKFLVSQPSQENIDKAESLLCGILNSNPTVNTLFEDDELLFCTCSLLNDIYHGKYKYTVSTGRGQKKWREEVERVLVNGTSGTQRNDQTHILKQRSNVREIECVRSYDDTNHCLINSRDSIITNAFVNSLADIQVMDYYDDLSVSKAISAVIIDNKTCFFTFFSDNEDKNLSDCLEILDRLYNFSFSSKEIALKLSSNIDIFVSGNYQYLTSMIDASVSNMGDQFYVRVHVCDYNKDCAQKLIVDAPLFIPCVKDKCMETPVNLVVFGAGEFVQNLLREVIGSCCFPVKPAVTVICEDSVREKQRFLQECPGIYKASENIERIIPEFLSCSVFSEDIEALLENYNSDNPLSVALNNCNYFVVDVGTDAENISFASNLRRWILRNDYGMSKVPFIAVKCSKSENAYLVSRMTINNKTPNHQIYNNFDLYCFGMADDLYTYNNLFNNEYNSRALALHTAYYDDDTPINTVLNSYYSFSYNRDSSKASALSMIYVLFSLGFIHSSEDLAQMKYNVQRVAKAYDQWIAQAGNLERASSIEHGRWTGFMLSRGWMPLDPRQTDVYAQSVKNGEHKHLLAKVHPFICNWDSFSDSASHTTIFYELKKRIDGLETPRNSTFKIMKKYSKILVAKNDAQRSNNNSFDR